MNAKPGSIECQIYCLPRMARPRKIIDNLQYLHSRAKRFLKRRITYLKNWFASGTHRENDTNDVAVGKNGEGIHLQTGDLVRIKPREVIQVTLNHWNSLKGCAFLEEMWPYCGTTQRVMKKVERFLDERDYRIKNTKKVIILENVICNGTEDFGRCDRSCYFFWREEWLEKLD